MNEKGLTLVEVFLAVAIIALLAGILSSPAFKRVMHRTPTNSSGLPALTLVSADGHQWVVNSETIRTYQSPVCRFKDEEGRDVEVYGSVVVTRIQ